MNDHRRECQEAAPSNRGGWVRAWRTIFLASISCFIGLASHHLPAIAEEPAAAPEATAATEAPPWVFELQIVGPDKKPIPNVTVETRSQPMIGAKEVTRGRFVMKVRYGARIKSDAEGRVTITRPKSPQNFCVTIEQPGFVPYWADWQNASKGEKPPKSFTAELDPAWTVGGIIVDQDGNPIENVEVHPRVHFKKRPGDEMSILTGTVVTTDFDGKWRYRCVPESVQSLNVEIAHPDYAPHHQSLTKSDFAVPPGVEPTAKIKLDPGLTVSGVVTKETGEPVEGAVVKTRFLNTVRQSKTDAEGRYRLTNCESGDARIVFSAKGCAMQAQQALIAPDMGPLNIQLKPGGVIRVRVLDQEGAPINKASVLIQRWGNSGAYGDLDHVRQYTNKEGLWEWRKAPYDELNADISGRVSQGMQLEDQILKPRDEEYVFRIPPAQQISGRVTDAETGKPIESFRATLGIRFSGNEKTYWESREAFSGDRGQYQLTNDRQFEHQIKIEADGYRVATSRAIHHDEGNVEVDIKLNKAAPVVTTIVGPDGKPAGRAKVAFTGPGNYIRLENGELNLDSPQSPRMETDETGKFTIPAQDASVGLFVTHAYGYAQFEIGETPPAEVRLTPSARMEGTARVGKRPLANEELVLSVNGQSVHEYQGASINMSFQAKTDAEGRFVFERAFPGIGYLSRSLVKPPGSDAQIAKSTPHVQMTLKTGETTRVEWGGSGRTVKGKLAQRAGATSAAPWHDAVIQLRPEVSAVAAIVKALAKTGGERPMFQALVDRDGSFQIDDVPTGAYSLNVWFPRVTEDSPEIGGIKDYRFDVNEQKDDETHIDLGVLTLPAP